MIIGEEFDPYELYPVPFQRARNPSEFARRLPQNTRGNRPPDTPHRAFPNHLGNGQLPACLGLESGTLKRKL